MGSSYKNAVGVSIFGESHGPAIGVVLDGLTPGIVFDEEKIRCALARRRAQGAISTARHEEDDYEILSGVHEGHLTGTPLAAIFRNRDVRDADYEEGLVRPGHADYASAVHYDGFADPTGGGHSSGRLTAPLVFAGAVASLVTAPLGITVATHVKSLENETDRSFNENDLSNDFLTLASRDFPVLLPEAEEKMKTAILAAKADGDSVGGVLETAAILPAGLGEPFFDSVESTVSRLVYSVPGVKGIAFGLGYGFAGLRGSQANDAFRYDENGHVRTLTNHNGGVNGGMSNGMPLLFTTVMKPTSSISRPQESINLATHDNVTLALKGRHDPAIIHRAAICITAATEIALWDLCVARFGTEGGAR